MKGIFVTYKVTNDDITAEEVRTLLAQYGPMSKGEPLLFVVEGVYHVQKLCNFLSSGGWPCVLHLYQLMYLISVSLSVMAFSFVTF